MCGISCLISREYCQSSDNENTKKLNELLKCRGPDLCCEKIIQEFASDTHRHYYLKLSSYILWTQGNFTEQPFENDDQTKLFAFNGDIYSFSSSSSSVKTASQTNSHSFIEHNNNSNDGLYFFNLLNKCKTPQDIIHVISNLHGPFAFILVDKLNNTVWFGRDYFGRSSLLLSVNDEKSFCISSVSPANEFGNVCEIPSSGLFCLDFDDNKDDDDSIRLTIYPWNCSTYRQQIEENTKHFIDFVKCKLNFSVEIHQNMKINCVATKLKSIPNDDLNQYSILQELHHLSTLKLKQGELLLKAREILNDSVQTFEKFLRNAVQQRVNLKPPYCKKCIKTLTGLSRNAKNNQTQQKEISCTHSKICVLFSGGLDSAVLAYLVAECLPEGETLDLVNVAFSPDELLNYDVPDRQTGIQSYKALKEIFEPRGVKINFVEANITKSNVTKIRKECILDLISPLQSVLDDSIGICLWFASRAQGLLTVNPNSGEETTTEKLYQSTARIVFIGSGIDEMLGGYSRHRSAFESKSWQGLLDEMQEDIDRISSRNLGRDNRVITNHGIVPRMPFLDENVVHFLTQECDLWIKCCPFLPRGIGEKLLLRCLAVQLFGEENVHLALFPKRAMQFGSRIAKLENSKEKGGDVCRRLQVN